MSVTSSFTIVGGRVYRRAFSLPAPRGQRRPRISMPSRYTGRTKPRWADEYGTIGLVLEVLREAGRPMRILDILERAGDRLPTKASGYQGRRNVVARDLVRELAQGEKSRVRRVDIGLYQAVTP